MCHSKAGPVCVYSAVGSCKPQLEATPTRTKSRCCCGGKSELRRLSKGRMGVQNQLWIVHEVFMICSVQWALPFLGVKGWIELSDSQAVGPRKQSLLGGTKIGAEATHRPAGGHCSTVSHYNTKKLIEDVRHEDLLQQSVQPYCFCHNSRVCFGSCWESIFRRRMSSWSWSRVHKDLARLLHKSLREMLGGYGYALNYAFLQCWIPNSKCHTHYFYLCLSYSRAALSCTCGKSNCKPN